MAGLAVPTTSNRHDHVERTLEAVWRMEWARIVATLTRIVRDVGLAEDVAQDAFEAALRQWPSTGIPDNPAAWLIGTAKHRGIDAIRRRATLERKTVELAHHLGLADGDDPDLAATVDDASIADDLLRLMFICCHPLLSLDARVALTLRLLGGLHTDEIARAFLTSTATVGQRISRAKRTLSEAHVPFDVPQGEDLQARLEAVLQVVYLIFNEGYSATAGDDAIRPALCEEALRLGRILAGLAPDEPEVHGLVALMEIQASRTRARTDPAGAPIPLLEQHRERWDGVFIDRGLKALERADAGPGARGAYTLQAAIAACHAQARSADQTDWAAIAALYDALGQLSPSPIVELNRAVAVGMADGAAVGLQIVDTLLDEPALQGYHLLPAVRGELLGRAGCHAEASIEFARSAALTRNLKERNLLLARARTEARSGATGRDEG